ncbi:hypothetical protein LEMLEM_LOCUS17335 [Lemmus lemmus]
MPFLTYKFIIMIPVPTAVKRNKWVDASKVFTTVPGKELLYPCLLILLLLTGTKLDNKMDLGRLRQFTVQDGERASWMVCICHLVTTVREKECGQYTWSSKPRPHQ